MSKKDEGRHSNRAKEVFYCVNCKNNDNKDICDLCIIGTDINGNQSIPSAFIENKYEYVDHPSHYGGEDNPYECIKVIEAWGLDRNFDLGTAVRYICRAGEKPDNPTLQDLKKARWYLDREIQKLEKER